MKRNELSTSILIIITILLLSLCVTSSTNSYFKQQSKTYNNKLLPPDDAVRMKWMYEAIHRATVELDQNKCGSQEKHPCGGRDFSNGAVAAYLLSKGKNASGAIHWLSKVQPGGSFVGQGFCALAHEANFMNNLNSTQKSYVLNSINKALPGLSAWQGADVSYSNMYMMGMVNCIICGEAPGVNETLGAMSAQHGYKLLNDWLIYAKTAGNHEYNSPTYYWVQLNALQLGCMYSKDLRKGGGKEKLCQMLDHIWSNVIVNYFNPTETMAGPHSRDYDFLYGHGALQVHTYINGFGTHYPICEYRDAHCERTDDGQNALTLLNAVRARDGSGIGYLPSLKIRQLLDIPIRIIESKWLGQKRTANNESAVFGDRYNYIVSGKYTIGSTSSDYITNTHTVYYPHPQDKLVSMNFALTNMSQYQPMPSITIVPDWMDLPYGHTYQKNINKPSHLASHPGCVQYENILLNTNSINPTEQLDGFNQTIFDNLATNILLPLHNVTETILNGETIQYPIDKKFEIPVQIDDTITFRVEDSCLSIKILHVDTTGDYNGKNVLKGDAYGIDLNTIRLAFYHYIGKNRTLAESTHVKTAFIFLMDTCSNRNEMIELNKELSNDAKVTIETTEKMEWIVTLNVRGKDLQVVRDISEPHCERWSCLINRTINGVVVEPKSLRVNGMEIGVLPEPSSDFYNYSV